MKENYGSMLDCFSQIEKYIDEKSEAAYGEGWRDCIKEVCPEWLLKGTIIGVAIGACLIGGIWLWSTARKKHAQAKEGPISLDSMKGTAFPDEHGSVQEVREESFHETSEYDRPLSVVKAEENDVESNGGDEGEDN